MKELPQRKPNRLKDYDYSQDGAYYVTICAKNRENLFGTIIVGATAPGRPFVSLSELGKCVDETINNAHNNVNNYIKIDKYMIMPNHVHLIVVICSETGDRGRSPLQFVVRNIKSYVSKWAGFAVWQKSFHDHIIRNEEEYQKIWEYIDSNLLMWEADKETTFIPSGADWSQCCRRTV